MKKSHIIDMFHRKLVDDMAILQYDTLGEWRLAND
jgi:hypothetical protein